MKSIAIILCLITSASCTQDFLGFSRGERLSIYKDVLNATGNSKIGTQVGVIGERVNRIDTTSGK